MDEPAEETDPMEQQALNERLMTDPDLVTPDTLANGDDRALPAIGNNSKLVAAAQDEAADLIGGRSALRALPEPRGFPQPLSAELFQDLEAFAEHAGVRRDCIAKLETSAVWAARLPETVGVYPRGATMAAAGTDDPDCSLRLVRYRTPVPLNEVLRWYFTRARAAGRQVSYKSDGTMFELAATDAQPTYRIIARSLASDLNEIALVAASR